MGTWAGDVVAPHRSRVPWLLASAVPLLTLVFAWGNGAALAPSPVFVPVWLVLVVSIDLMTTALLVEQYRSGGSPRVLALTWAYTWSATLAGAVLAGLPGAITPDGLLGLDVDHAVWLMLARLVGTPAFVVVSLVPWAAPAERWLGSPRHRVARTVLTQANTAVTALGLVAAVVSGLLPLPRVTRVTATGDVVLLEGAGAALVALTSGLLVVGLLGLRGRRADQGLEGWAVVSLAATAGSAVLVAVSGATYDLAWYGARVLGLVATAVVLHGLLRDLGHLQGRVRRYARRLEAQNAELVEAQGLREHLVAVVSHDMRNPLTGLAGYLDVIDDAELSDADLHRVLERSRLLTRRLTLMTEDLLASASVADLSVVPRRVDLRGQLDECVAGFPDLDVIVRCPVDLAVEVDPLRLQQVLANLLRNAQVHGAEPVRLTATRYGGSTAQIAVGDAGGGVPEEFVPRLFDRYSRAAPDRTRGSGLGLSISRRLAERHGGSLDYDPAAREFVVRLPAEPRRRGGLSVARSTAAAPTPAVRAEPA